MTNFDEIKRMTVEEFARFMNDGTTYFINDLCEDARKPQPITCKNCEFFFKADCRYYLVKKWLEKEVNSND